MKKVLIFSTAYFPFIGGAEVAVKEISDRLSTFEFDMITARLDKKLAKIEKIGQVNVYRLGFGCFLDKYWLALYGAIFTQKLHRQKKYDAIWSIMASYNSFAAVSFKKRNHDLPYLLTLQEGDPIEYILEKTRLVSFWFKKIFSQADYIQAISNFLANWAKDMGSRCPIQVIPNGVSVNSIQSPTGNNQKIKSELSIQEDDKVIITISRLVVKNGVGDLIDGFFKLLEDENFKKSKLLILGDGPLKESLKEKIKRMKLENKVLMLGHILPDRVLEYLAISDVFVRPSLSEGLGNVFLEAMAAGVPIIGTNVGGIPDFLKDSETGLFCEVNNPSSIAQKIKLLLTDKILYQKLVNNGRQLVRERYDWDKIAPQMEIIFNNLIKK
jgi:glycosyltransferase involved in cell wall biosynthesis